MEINKDLQETISLYSPEVQKNIRVASADMFPVPYGLRIDPPGFPSEFWPRMPATAAPSEDKTVPRVVTASTIVGCMNGAYFVLDKAQRKAVKSTDCENFYKILRLDFEQCILPSKELVFDAVETQEQWLVAYNKETTNYKPKVIGEMFLTEVSSRMLPNSPVNKTTAVILLAVFEDPGVAITQNKVVGKGFYRVEMDMTRYIASKTERMRFDDDSLSIEKPISKELYDSYRKIFVKKGY